MFIVLGLTPIETCSVWPYSIWYAPYLGVAMRSQSVFEEEAISDHLLHKSETLQNRHSSEIVKWVRLYT